MSLRQEWDELLRDMGDFYIYGAGSVAKKLYTLSKEDDNKGHNLIAFIVTDMLGNPKEIDGYPVITIDELDNKESTILMSISFVYHSESYSLLKDKGYLNVINAHKFSVLDIRRRHDIEDLESLINRDIQLSDEDLRLRTEVVEMLTKLELTFGGDIFYQSYPRLGINGERPTDIRIETYKIKEYISLESVILDIGCNCGFIDLTLASLVKKVVGIEYDEHLVSVAQKVAKGLSINNAHFSVADYNEWQKNTTDTYNLIFSFAVHIWLNVLPLEYIKRLNELLNYGGYVLFESQTYETDIKYIDFYNAFISEGFAVCDDIVFKDDGVTTRRMVVFQKPL